MVRWSYLIPRLLLAGLLWAFLQWGFDPLLRHALVKAGETAVGAKVDVEELETSFFPPQVAVRNVQVANRRNPWKNLLQFGEFRLQLAGRPLLQKSFVVEEGRLTGLQFGTPRSTSGVLNGEDDGPANKYWRWINNRVKEAGRNWYDDFQQRMKMQIDPQQLTSVQLAGKLEKEWAQRFDTYEKRLRNIESRSRKLEKAVKSARGNALQKLQTYQRAFSEAQRLLRDVNRIQAELQQLPQQAAGDFQRLDAARRFDQQQLRKKFEAVTQPDAASLSEMLLGPVFSERLAETLQWLQWTRDGIQKLTRRPPRPRRLPGTTFDFARHERLPRFLIRRLSVSGTLEWQGERIPLTGTIEDVTNEPRLYGRPAIVRLRGKGTSAIQLHAVLDDTTAVPRREIRLTLNRPVPQTVTLGDPEEEPLRVRSERTTVTGEVVLTGEALQGRIDFRQSGLQVMPPEKTATAEAGGKKGHRTGPEKKTTLARKGAVLPKQPDIPDLSADFSQMLYAAAAEVRDLQATILLDGTVQKPRWKLQSNLGEQMSAGLQRAVAGQLMQKQQQLAGTLDKVAKSRTGELSKRLNGRYGDLLSQIDLQKNGLQKIIRQLTGFGGRLPFGGTRLFGR